MVFKDDDIKEVELKQNEQQERLNWLLSILAFSLSCNIMSFLYYIVYLTNSEKLVLQKNLPIERIKVKGISHL